MVHPSLTQILARYLDVRLADTALDGPWPARLYGLDVIDPLGARADLDGAVRFVCVAEGIAEVLLEGPGRFAAAHHDALALVTPGWATDLAAVGPAARGGTTANCGRRRARRRIVVTVVGAPGAALGSVLRDCATGEVCDPGAVGGVLAAHMSTLWPAA